MSSIADNTVGEIDDTGWQKYIEWQIQNYFSLPQKADTFFNSPIFHFSNASWCVRIYPNGERENETVEWMSLYLIRLDSNTRLCPLTFSLGFKYGKMFDEEPLCYCCFKNDRTVCGFPRFIKRTELYRNKQEFLPDNMLTLVVKAKESYSIVEPPSQTHLLDGVKGLSEDFGNLLHTEEKSDVTIRVKDRLFRVHKLLLGTRSSVFSAMFEHNMKETSTGVVDIVDCEPDVFTDFLTFVYTGKIEKFSPSRATSLYSLADKYDLNDLKMRCMDFMKDNLCLDNVCEVVTLADRHSKEELKVSAIELIRRNIQTIIPTDQWISFMVENPFLAAEILMNVIPKINS